MMRPMGARTLWAVLLATVVAGAACNDDEDGVGGAGGSPSAGSDGRGLEAGHSGTAGDGDTGGTSAGGTLGGRSSSGGRAGRSNANAGKGNDGAGGSLGGSSTHAGGSGDAGLAMSGQSGDHGAGQAGVGASGGDGGSAGVGGNTSGAGAGGLGGNPGASGLGGNPGVAGKDSRECELTQADFFGEASWSSSNVPCGRLGDLSDDSGPLLDVGHSGSVTGVARTSDRVVSTDTEGNWVLWDLTAETLVTRGATLERNDGTNEMPALPLLTDDTLVVLARLTPLQLELRSAIDGTIRATLPVPGLNANTPYGVALDGSYVWAAGSTELVAFDANGTLLFSKIGDYTSAQLFAAPNELRVAEGPAGNSVIETIATPSGTSTTSATFQGEFHSWFVGGERFLTTIGNTVRVYSENVGAAEVLVSLPTIQQLTGQGDYFWTYRNATPGYPFDVYSVLAGGTLAQSYSFGVFDPAIPGGTTVGVLRPGQLDLVELGGSSIMKRTVPMPGLRAASFAANLAGEWALGDEGGAVFESANLNRALSCGSIQSIAGATDGTVAIATSGGRTLLFRLTGDTREYLGDVPLRSSHVELSSDGSILASANLGSDQYYASDRSLRVLGLPSRTELKVWPYTFDTHATSLFTDYEISADGNRFVHLTKHGLTFSQRVLDFDDNVDLVLSPSSKELARLSPDGTRIAAPSGPFNDAGAVTNFYESGVLVDAVAGSAVAWLDADRVLIARMWDMYLYNAVTHVEQLTGLINHPDTQVISPELTYGNNRIESVPSGEPVWYCDHLGRQRAVAADHVVFVPAAALGRVMFERY
jgi:hypothetical protein